MFLEIVKHRFILTLFEWQKFLTPFWLDRTLYFYVRFFREENLIWISWVTFLEILSKTLVDPRVLINKGVILSSQEDLIVILSVEHVETIILKKMEIQCYLLSLHFNYNVVIPSQHLRELPTSQHLSFFYSWPHFFPPITKTSCTFSQHWFKSFLI